MESYKEKYEQALKMAQETYNTQPMYREWLDKMFPELKEKESEDEKVREALIRFHKSTIDIDGIKGADIISWLEKQGEQKPSDEEMKTLLYTEYEKGRADVIAEIQKEWKPSEGQIRFLQAMVNDPNNASSESCQIVLKDILEKLKKLKEE